MAGPLTTGPAHLFLGVPFTLASVIGSTHGNGTLTRSLRVASNGPPPATGPGAMGGTIENNPDPAPPSYTLSVLQGRVPVYLGTCKRSPRIIRTPFYLPWHEDGLGTSGAADELYEGEEHVVMAPDLNRLNEPLVAWAQNATAGVTGGRRGLDLPGAVGTSMTWEGATFPLWVQFPHAAKLVNAFSGLPAGYRYYNARLVGPDALGSLGLEPMERTLTFHCGRYLDLLSGVSGTYDHDMRGLPVIS